MTYLVRYTPEAEETFAGIYKFIYHNFGQRTAAAFAAKADQTIRLIAQNPQMYKAFSIDPEVRIGMISKQTSIFYQISAESINLLFFWDNRQEPMVET